MKKRILAICGSTRSQSANLKLLQLIADWSKDRYDVEIFEGLAQLPHFNPDSDKNEAPVTVQALRTKVSASQAVLICTPEYVFSMPGSLKNALEWMVSTTLFSDKPCGLITASASGKKGHAELALVMKTIGAKFTPKTRLLLSGIKGKFNADGQLSDEKTRLELLAFLTAFDKLLL